MWAAQAYQKELQRKTKKAPGKCPGCKRGMHWAKECKSKMDTDGNQILGKFNSENRV